MVSNKYLYKWFESDFISITKANYLTEYEIKITISDFKRDFTHKPIKHTWLNGKRVGELFLENDIIVDKLTDTSGDYYKNDNKYIAQTTIKMEDYIGPNYFYYVCPENLIKEADIPEYAGLMYYIDKGYYRVHIIKSAPKLHKIKVTDETKLNILTRYMYDYWKNNYEKK